VLGKPAMADMSLGLATAPLLYAAEQIKELRPLIKRRFKEPGDKEAAFRHVLSTDAVARSRELARWHAQRAVDAASRLPPSEARDALVNVCHVVLTRNK
jgi:geranylgeranyl pyrophosphate synthase